LQFLAGLVCGLPLRLLRCGDLLLDLDHGPAHDLAVQPRHRGVDHLGALLGHLCKNRCRLYIDPAVEVACDDGAAGDLDLVLRIGGSAPACAGEKAVVTAR
jgi:hypothetical protein